MEINNNIVQQTAEAGRAWTQDPGNKIKKEAYFAALKERQRLEKQSFKVREELAERFKERREAEKLQRERKNF